MAPITRGRQVPSPPVATETLTPNGLLSRARGGFQVSELAQYPGHRHLRDRSVQAVCHQVRFLA